MAEDVSPTQERVGEMYSFNLPRTAILGLRECAPAPRSMELVLIFACPYILGKPSYVQRQVPQSHGPEEKA